MKVEDFLMHPTRKDKRRRRCHSTSMLPPQAQALLAELAMVEEEITRLEKKIKTLKMSLDRENKHNRMHLSDKNFEGFSCQSVNNASSTTSSSEDDAAASRILGWRSRHQSYPNPNELSQDLIKSLVTIFMRLDKPATDAASNPDPYCLFSDSDGPARDIGPYKHSIQITKCSLDESHASACLPTFESVRVLMLKLCAVNLICLTYEQRLAFWMNIYNACIMHAFLKHGLPSTQEKLLALMNKAVVNVGGIVLNALAIEHFILRRPADSSPDSMEEKETLLRHACGLERPEPNVTFALCRGCHSSPALRVYSGEGVGRELEREKAEYLEAAVGVTGKKTILLPRLLQWHMRDFGGDVGSLVEWISGQLPRSGSLWRSMEECLGPDNVGGRTGCPPPLTGVEFQDFRSQFRYLIMPSW